MGIVLIWLMHNRPEGLLGHRKEHAASVPLVRSTPKQGAQATDGGSEVERDE